MLMVGTKKGAFLLESKDNRSRWELRGPFCETWPVQHMSFDPATRTVYAAAGSSWFGPSVWQSPDLGKTWTQSSAGMAYGEGEPAVELVWNVTPAHGALYAGVAPAGLFRSDDGGASWEHVAALREHPSKPEWMPGAGGLMAHSIVPHPSDPESLWVGISSVGTFKTEDGGKHWAAQNKGVRADYFPDPYPEFGQCVHCLVAAPGDAGTLYQQNHSGMYRSRDGGASWQDISGGLPSRFGFPVGVHPRDRQTIWTFPLNGDQAGRYPPEGAAAVWRSRDGGDSWERHGGGLPQRDAYFGVLRQALGVDSLDPAGVYIGTSTGEIFASRDEGETWECISSYLPAVSSVGAVVLDR